MSLFDPKDLIGNHRRWIATITGIGTAFAGKPAAVMGPLAAAKVRALPSKPFPATTLHWISREPGATLAVVAHGALEERVIVIVGGTTGLGLSGALACVGAGARVVVIGRDQESVAAAAKEFGDFGRAVAADARDPAAAPAAIDLALRELGRFDGLYHVAGGSGRREGDGPLHELSDGGWDYTRRLNLDSMFYSDRAAVRQFLKQKTSGTILNLGSVLADSPSTRHFATHAYAAAKAGALGLTRSAAAFYAPHNIRFNLLAPGLTRTPMSRRADTDDAIRGYVASKQPLDGGRIGAPQDLDAAVVFFLSDASAFVTGQVLDVDGGWSVTEGQHGD